MRPIVLALALTGAGAAAVLVFRAGGPSPRPAEGFRDEVVLRGLEEPLGLAFARDGSVVVAEKRGRIKIFSRLGADRHVVFADLGRRIFRLGDRGSSAWRSTRASRSGSASTCSTPSTGR